MLRFQQKLAKYYDTEFLIKHGTKIEEMQAKKDTFGLIEDPKTLELIALSKFEILNTLCQQHRDKINKVSKLANLILVRSTKTT
jgi:hypothetical protein